MNTSTVIAVSIAIIVAVSFIFFGPFIIRSLNYRLVPTTNSQTTGKSAQVVKSTGSSDSSKTQAENTDKLSVTDEVVGTGEVAKSGDVVSVQYVGTLEDGTVFDSTKAHGDKPFTFTLGVGQVIKGWDDGVVGMKVGGVRKLVIPASLGYGDRAVGPIPANSTLIFEVKLEKVSSSDK